MLEKIKQNLLRVKELMKKSADLHRPDVDFHVGASYIQNDAL